MGSRLRGSIEPGSMPPLHRYFGTPVTTWILNVIFGSTFSDIHCGMRGITRDALARMDLRSQSWEYASEMVLKSVHMELRTAEVPVTLPQGPRGAAEPPQARGLVLALAGGLDQPARDVRLRLRLLPLQAGPRAAGARAAADACRSASANIELGACRPLAQLAVPRRRAPRRRCCRRSSSAASRRCCSTTPAGSGVAGCASSRTRAPC